MLGLCEATGLWQGHSFPPLSSVCLVFRIHILRGTPHQASIKLSLLHHPPQVLSILRLPRVLGIHGDPFHEPNMSLSLMSQAPPTGILGPQCPTESPLVHL